MQAVFPAIKAAAGGVDALDWLDAKFRFYAIDMENAGPAAGAWKVSDAGWVLNGSIYELEIICSVAHGVVVGDYIALFGLGNSGMATWATSTSYSKDQWRKANPNNGKKYRVLATGTSGGSLPTFPTIDGTVFVSGGVAAMCDGPDTSYPYNGNYTVTQIISTTAFRIAATRGNASPGASPTFIASYIANLSKTYLSEFASSGARTASGDIPLIDRSILPGAIFDGGDVQINMTSRPLSQVLTLVKVAALHANTDLADTAQELVAYYDTQTGLPLAANSGISDLLMSNGPDRIFRW